MSSKDSQAVSVDEFRKLQQQFNKLLDKQGNHNANHQKVIIEKDPRNERTNLKPTKLPEFYGNRAEYPAWRAAVLDTFRMDWLLFGYDNSRAFLMIYNALKSTVRTKAGSFYENGGVHNTRDPEDFIEFLDRIYMDSTRVPRANTKLHSMKMRGNQPWSDFYASWSNKLTEARGDFWPDDNKISMLQSALNKNQVTALAANHLLPDDDFHEWIKIVNKVAQRLEMVDTRFRRWQNNVHVEDRRANESSHNDSSPYTVQNEVNNGQEVTQFRRRQAGDTVMSGVNAINVANTERRRGKWKTKAQIEKLRKEGRCFRCERRGCVTSRCPMLPAKKPKNLRVNSVALPEIDPSMYTTEEENINTEN